MSENIDIATGAIDAKPPIVSYGDDRDHESKNRDTGDLVGIEAELADAGLRSANIELGDDGIARVVGKDEGAFGNSDEDLRSAADVLAASRLQADELPVREIKLTEYGEDAAPDIALKSPEQAADVLAKMRENDALVAEIAEADQTLAEYDLNAEPPLTQAQQDEIVNQEAAQAPEQQPTGENSPVQSDQLPGDDDPNGQLAHAMRTNAAVRQVMVDATGF